MITKPLLQKVLKGILHMEDENKHNHERTGGINSHENNIQALRVDLYQLHTLRHLNNKNN
jgi:hypothetical protein